jgi:hypothetical protein
MPRSGTIRTCRCVDILGVSAIKVVTHFARTTGMLIA